MATYRISELAGRTGVPATTLRFYEKQRLLPASRTPAGYRVYTDADVDRVQFIGAAKHLGLPLEQIRELLGVWDGGMCREIRDELGPKVAAQVTAADERIADLQAFRDGLHAALTHLRELPAKDGPCDPACAFLQDLPDRVPAPELKRQSAARLPLAAVTETDRPMVACGLDDAQYDERAARWRQLLAGAPRARTTTGRISVQLPVDRAAAVAELVVVEQACCPFLTFHLTFVGATVELTADAPAQAQPLLDALFHVAALPVEESRSSC